jgi:hypothetical protein
MNTDTLFNIYQSYTLTKVSELNKHSLVALYAQNEQLSKLNQELARANRTTEQILRNQIKEIEQQERRCYFKNMTFNLSQAMTLLEKEENVNFRIFASNLLLSPIRDMAKNAVQELEEIADKEYAQNIVIRANTLSDNDKTYYDSYKETPWVSFLSAKTELSDFILKNRKKVKQLTSNLEEARKNYKEIVEKNNKKKDKNPVTAKDAKKGCVGCSLTIIVFLLLFIIGTYYTQDYNLTKGGVIFLLIVCLISGAYYFYGEKKGWDKYTDSKEDIKRTTEKQENEEKDQEEKIETLSNELTNLQQEETRLTTQYNNLVQEITADCPKWERKLSEIADYIPHEDKRKIENKDPLLFEAAKLIVKKQDASTSLIQRKFSIGYNRAGRIMDQLEILGVVGPTKGLQSRDLYCESEEELSEMLNFES